MAGGGGAQTPRAPTGKRAQRVKKSSGIIIIFPGKPGRRLEDLSTSMSLEIIQIIFGRGNRGILDGFYSGGGGNGRQRGNSNQGGSNEKTRPTRKRVRGSM